MRTSFKNALDEFKSHCLKVTTEISSSLKLIMTFAVELNSNFGLTLPPSGFSSITQKREKIFSSNLVNFCIDKWVTICTIKLEDRPFRVAMPIAQNKGVEKLDF